jgi:hypothetical protein
MQKLFTCLFGSRLYGTQTPTSDLDVKHVYLPSLDDMLVGKLLVNKVKKTNTEKNTRNGADDVDEEFLPLQVFARDFLNGQTYALEMAFAVDGTHAQQELHDDGTGLQANAYRQFVYELRSKFLTSNVKALMGYAVNQASLYSFKGERLNVVREVQALLRMTANAFVNVRLSDCMVEDKQFAQMMRAVAVKYPKYFQETTYDVGGGDMRPCFKLLEKTLPFSDRASQASRVVEALEKRYGTRADAASADNVDWKATMHALRVVDEGLQLLEFGTMTFPFSQNYVDYLLDVKHGNVDLALVKDELDEKLERLKALEQTTTLRPLTQELKQEFDKWLAQWMRRFYSGVENAQFTPAQR